MVRRGWGVDLTRSRALRKMEDIKGPRLRTPKPKGGGRMSKRAAAAKAKAASKRGRRGGGKGKFGPRM